MPAKNALKLYIPGGFYHIYNRGIDKRIIFLDEQDYAAFLNILKTCLLPVLEPGPLGFERYPPKSVYGDVELLAFVLMPNHFHLFVQQQTNHGIETLMRSIMTRYVLYFNKKYVRHGHLFGGIYKAIDIETEPYFLHISRYIHRNPRPIINTNLEFYPYSSYPYYLGLKQADWLNTSKILSFFGSALSPYISQYQVYKDFVESDVEELLPSEVMIDMEEEE